MCALAGFAFPVFGQGGIGSGNAAQRAPHPYTAKFQITSEQTLVNGTTITREATDLQIRDSEGRIRMENTTPAHEEMPERTIFHINDPVARVDVMWVSSGKTVSVRKRPPLPQPGQQRACWSYSTDEHENTVEAPIRQTAPPEVATAKLAAPLLRNQSTHDDLGVQTIQGVEAVGTRITETTPAGTVGNDAPLVRTTETWRAKSLPLVVRSVTDDPRTGKRTQELVELNQSEPDPALFELPEGYRVVTSEPHEVACSR
jgi:hypothetical protein